MKKLISAAENARKNAYAPYSDFRVGAAIETKDGRIFVGCNVENASYGLTVCSERVAVFKAVSEGAKKFKRIAIASGNEHFAAPCGACCQVLAEFNPKIEIVLINSHGRVQKTNLTRLYPKPFRLS